MGSIFVIDKRNAYTKEIGEETIAKVREKALQKQEKGKSLKGRKGIVFSILDEQDSTEKANKIIVSNCNNKIQDLNNEINTKQKLIKITKRNIQFLLDLENMQNQFASTNTTECTNFNDLVFYTLNEEIKIVTVLKKGTYTIPTLPAEWKKAKIEADLLVEEKIGEEGIEKINQKYQKSGGKWRSLTEEEGYDRGLITTIIKPVQDVIFDESYLKERDKPNLDSLIYIPYSSPLMKYKFSAKEIHPTIIEQSQGEIDKYFFEISADYNDIFSGLDQENIILRRHGERGNLKVGSLEKTITNGNWGE